MQAQRASRMRQERLLNGAGYIPLKRRSLSVSREGERYAWLVRGLKKCSTHCQLTINDDRITLSTNKMYELCISLLLAKGPVSS
jgi:hypothetical protein